VRRSTLSGAVVVLVVVAACAGQDEFAEVRDANDKFREVSTAEADGYEEFLECFDSDAGGMGQHYVDLAALDGDVDAARPEAMVYEVSADGSLELAGVEYIVPNADPPDGQTTAPELYGRSFQLVEELNIWAMHAWVWTENPDGAFEGFNPNVAECPA